MLGALLYGHGRSLRLKVLAGEDDDVWSTRTVACELPPDLAN
jgi:hypothetical protein